MKRILSETPLSFIVDASNLEGRIDVNYYKPEYREVLEKLRGSLFKPRRLGDIAALSSERWKKAASGTFRYIEISDIDTFSAKILRAKEIEVEDAPSRAQFLVRTNDIIVSTTRPYRGAIALVTQEFNHCVCSSGFAIIRKLKDKMDRKYLLRVLHSNLALKQMEQRMTGGNYPAISPAELLEIQIPVPPIEAQKQIIAIMDEVLYKKKEMEKEAGDLLDSIDNYLLIELGISLTVRNEKSPMSYKVNASLLKKKRWDVDYWKPKYMSLEEAIKNGKYPSVRFESLIARIVNGVDYRIFTDEGTKYLRVGNVKPFEIDETDIKHVSISLDDVKKDVKLEEGDILLTRKGTFGIAISVTRGMEYLISSEIFRVKLTPKIEINPSYVVVVLNSSIGRMQCSRKSTGAIMGSLSQNAVKSILVPIPPKSVQGEITNEVKERIGRAKQLTEKARKALENARQKVDRLILGEEER